MRRESSSEMLPKARALGMKDEEYSRVEEILGRVPTSTELAMYSVEWSEHCGYPRSKSLLRLLPKKGHYASLSGADTGGIEIEPGLFIVFKMESHNHPSQVEPRQGAATGIGGIVRDIFTCGARPIACLDSLRFGNLDDPQHGRQARYLFAGVVEGISWYGNCLAGHERVWVRRGASVRNIALREMFEQSVKEGVALSEPLQVLSFDIASGRGVWREVEAMLKQQAPETVEIKAALGRSLRVTPEHPVMVVEGEAIVSKPAALVAPGDRIPLLSSWPEAEAQTEPQVLQVLEEQAPLRVDLLAHTLGRRSDIWAHHEVSATEKPRVQSVLRQIVPDAGRRHAYIARGRFPVAVYLELEKALGWAREEARLSLGGGRSHVVPAIVRLDGEFARMVGYFLSEGCLSRNGSTSKLAWVFGGSEQDYVSDLCSILDGLGWRYSRRGGDSTLLVWMSSWFLAVLFGEILGTGKGAGDKSIPGLLLEQGREVRREVLKGMLRGDGSVSLKKAANGRPTVSFASCSRALFEQALLLLQDEGIVPGVYTRPAGSSSIQGKSHPTRACHILEVSAFESLQKLRGWFGSVKEEKLEAALSRYQDVSQSYPRHRAHTGFASVSVREVVRHQEPEDVYDLQVAGTHLFVTSHGIITHNCIGVPTVAGEIAFNPAFRGNCLVGAMSVGVVRREDIASGAAAGEGNSVMYFGNATGRDGIGGCSVLASHEMSDSAARPTVQVGDPFAEKCLIEACLEALKTGAIVSMKDMGAAGLTCTTCEQAAEGGVGMEINLDLVPLREADMEAFEIMMSESQERMLAVVTRGREEEVAAIFRRWGQHAVAIGSVRGDGILRVSRHGEIVAEMSAQSLADAPTYNLPAEEPKYLQATRSFDFSALPVPSDWNATLVRMLSAPNIASKEWAYRQYDHSVQVNTVVVPGDGDAAVLRVRESASGKGIAVKADCNSRYCYLDPFEGARLAVVECARNLICVGAEPAGVTDCLCFGNPEKPERFWQFKRAVEGLVDICTRLHLPVVSGNVSLYNETAETAVYPSPLIGMVGVLPDVNAHTRMAFRQAHDLIVLLGDSHDELGGSEYAATMHGVEAGVPPRLDLERELSVQKLTVMAIRAGLLHSAHDCSDGGLAVALAESAIVGGLGARIELPDTVESSANIRLDSVLFGESQSRIVVSLTPENLPRLRDLARAARVPLSFLGTVGGERLVLSDARGGGVRPLIDLPLAQAADAWKNAIARIMEAGSEAG